MKITKIKHPKMVASDALQTRLRDEEDDLMSSAATNNGPQEQPRKIMDEVGPNRQGPTVPALKMKMMAEGGQVERPTADDMEVRPDKGFGKVIRVGLAEGGIAEAIMAKRRRMAEGGQVDLSINADEEPNNEDQMSFQALKKENYSETAGLEQMGSPEDSNQHGHGLDDDHDQSMTSQIRRRMLSRRAAK